MRDEKRIEKIHDALDFLDEEMIVDVVKMRENDMALKKMSKNEI